ncbi:helix-turn-helix domain-containing protein [Pseudophaeobacter flagellatus]|uniref:helix-turn-helix domain-containing protein n=1 Tax=Pseudophaeobacter flagellatus TaxID=2899119 RepID=UPI001E4D92D2|nr:XRE family transcriptional regulator [Pseudophaeobacter flagellatus]MCD9148498.1 XRE family transcriptional regulator [Pseudophaeobacter flagellatus]
MADVRAYAAQFGITPSTVIQKAGVGGGGTWAKWESGDGSPTLRTVDRLRAYIAKNPAPDADQTEDAA